MEDLTGKQFGQYQVVAPLGEGGMAAVYKAYQPAMERYVAIKVLPRHMSSSEEFIARFRREAKMLAQLQHVHILSVFDYGEEDGYPYIVMPFVPSGTLADVLQGKRLSLSEVRRILTQIGDALSYAHTRGMVHRDIKPSNILVDERGNCLLTDFGLARMTEVSTKITTSGAVMGTPAYMSPEQGTGSNIDQRSDIYSLGIILYEMVTGRVPYTAETPVAVVFKHLQDPLPSVRKYNANLPEAVELVLLKTLAKSPENRYQTAQDFVRALQIAIPDLSENQTSAPADAVSEKSIPSEKRQAPNKWILPAGILIGLSILTAGGFWANSQRGSQASPSQPISTPTVSTSAPLTTPTAVTIETQTPVNTVVPTITIPAPDRLSEYLNDVQILSMDTFDDPVGSGWNIDAGKIENGVMELVGNADWSFSYWTGEFGANEGIVIDFNYSTNSLSEIFLEYGIWNTDEYKRFGAYIGGGQATLDEYRGKEDKDYGGAILSGNLELQPGRTYSLLIAILPNGEFLEVIWDPSNPSETLSYREKIDETWTGLTWTIWIGVNQGTIQFDNFNQIRFGGAK